MSGRNMAGTTAIISVALLLFVLGMQVIPDRRTPDYSSGARPKSLDIPTKNLQEAPRGGHHFPHLYIGPPSAQKKTKRPDSETPDLPDFPEDPGCWIVQ